MLNPDSPIPLYHQLATILTDQIRSGTYTPGQAIPSENSLAGLYGIGRPTVRQAMDSLVKKGLVKRRRGSGTFVEKPSTSVDLFSLAGTSQAFLDKNIPVTTEIIRPMAGFLVPQKANTIENPFAGSRAFFMSRLTRAQDQPVLFEEIYMDPDLFSGIDAMDFEGQSLSRVVLDRYCLSPESATQQFQVTTLSLQTADLLGLSPDDPVLTVRRWLHFASAKGAIFSILSCRTDQFAFSQTIRPENR